MHLDLFGDNITDKDNKSDAVSDIKQTQDKNKNTEQKTLVLVVEEVIEIPDGMHEGLITTLVHRDDPFEYVDIHIKEKDSEATLKVGFPMKLTTGTGLGKFLTKMGVDLAVGAKIDLSNELLGAEVIFMTQNEETDKGTFARVIKDTVKPKE